MITLSKPALFTNASRFASADAGRYYLQGVHIEPAERLPGDDGMRALAGAYIVATNGHCMFVGYDEGAEWDGPAGNRLITVPKFKAADYKPSSADFMTWRDGRMEAHRRSSVRGDDPVFLQSWAAPEIDGSFPDWRRCLPTDATDSPPYGAFNAANVATFGKARAALTGKRSECFSWHGNGTGPARVALSEDAFGVIMPVRTWEHEAAAPDWLTLPAVSPMKIAAE